MHWATLTFSKFKIEATAIQWGECRLPLTTWNPPLTSPEEAARVTKFCPVTKHIPMPSTSNRATHASYCAVTSYHQTIQIEHLHAVPSDTTETNSAFTSILLCHLACQDM